MTFDMLTVPAHLTRAKAIKNVTHPQSRSWIARHLARWRLRSALRAFRKLRVPVQGRLTSLHKNQVYVVAGCLVTEAEIIASYVDGKLTAENIPTLLVEFRRLQRTNQLSKNIDLRDRRRSERVLLQLPVILVMEMEQGKHFRAQAFTQVVNAHGGFLSAPSPMPANRRCKLVSPQSGKEAGCRIVYVGEPLDGYFPTAFEFDQPNPQFWPLTIRPNDWATAEVAGTTC